MQRLPRPQNNSPRIVRARPVRKASALPLLPMLAASLLLLVAVQLVLWWWQARPEPGTAPVAGLTGNPFTDLAKLHPLSRDAAQPPPPPQRLNAPALPQNLQFGDPQARVVVTVFSDPSCGPCRSRTQAWLATLPPAGVRIVYKFWPQNPDRLTPGLLVLLAQKQGVTGAFWQRLEKAEGNLDDSALLNLLEASGVPLADQRGALVDGGAGLAGHLESDIGLARRASLPPPPVLLVDDYVIDGTVLQTERLAEYVAARLRGKAPGAAE
jgi:hypothetical protein